MRTIEQRIQFLLEQLHELSDIVADLASEVPDSFSSREVLYRARVLRNNLATTLANQVTFDDEE